VFTDPSTLPPHPPRGNPTAASSSSRPVADYSPTILTSRGAQQGLLRSQFRKPVKGSGQVTTVTIRDFRTGQLLSSRDYPSPMTHGHKVREGVPRRHLQC
jgi:hypothetical protein